MEIICIKASEYWGCYTLPYKVESRKQEIRFEGGLLKLVGPGTNELEQKRIYRPLA
jgi:hypothetical protein